MKVPEIKIENQHLNNDETNIIKKQMRPVQVNLLKNNELNKQNHKT